MAGIIIFIVLVVIALWILASCIRIVPQAYAIVVERLGKILLNRCSAGLQTKICAVNQLTFHFTG